MKGKDIVQPIAIKEKKGGWMVASGRGQHINAWKRVRRRRGEKPQGGGVCFVII
jgi:hypothetical protein